MNGFKKLLKVRQQVSKNSPPAEGCPKDGVVKTDNKKADADIRIKKLR